MCGLKRHTREWKLLYCELIINVDINDSRSRILLIATLIATTAIIIILFFLPAIIELKKPKDAGPRLISDDVPKIRISTLKVFITDIEEDQKFTYQSQSKLLIPYLSSEFGRLVFSLF